MPKAVWSHTLDSLISGRQPVSKASNASMCRTRSVAIATGTNRVGVGESVGNGCPTAKLKILEWSSAKSLVVCWCDSTAGRYGEQPWKLSIARARSTCALSGKKIKRGDKVYKPYWRGPKPANFEQLILASVIEQSLPIDPSDANSSDGEMLHKDMLEIRSAVA